MLTKTLQKIYNSLIALLLVSNLTPLQTAQTPESDLTQKLTEATTFIALYLSKNLQQKTTTQHLAPNLINKLNTHQPDQLTHQELQTLENHITQQYTQLDYIRRSGKRQQAEIHQQHLQHIYQQIPPHLFLKRIENTLQQNLGTYLNQLQTLPEDFLQHGGQSIIDPQYNDPTFPGLAPALRKKAVQLMSQKIQNTPQQDLTTHLHHLHEQIHQELQQNPTDQLYNLRNTLQQLINQHPSTQTHDQEETQDSDDDTDDDPPHNPDQVHVKIGKYIPPQQKKPTPTTIDQAQQLAQIYTQFMQQDGIYATPQEGALLATHYGMHFSTQTNKDPYNSDLPLPYEIKLQHSGNGILAHFHIFGCTTGNGNCLFNAFAQQLAHHYIQEKHKKPNGRTAQHTLARLALKNLYNFTSPTNTHPTENTPSPSTTPTPPQAPTASLEERITQYIEQLKKEDYRTLDHACMNGDLQNFKHLIENPQNLTNTQLTNLYLQNISHLHQQLNHTIQTLLPFYKTLCQDTLQQLQHTQQNLKRKLHLRQIHQNENTYKQALPHTQTNHPTTPTLNPDTSHLQKTITTNPPTDDNDHASDTEKENNLTTEIDNYQEYLSSDDSSLSDTTLPQLDQLPIPLHLPHLNQDHQARIKARLQLAPTSHLPTIIQLLNQKLAPLQDQPLCQNIGHYLAEIGHFYLHILQEKQPKDWVIDSLKLDIVRSNIQEKDTLALNLFEQTLHQYQATQTPKQFLKKLYTLHQYIYNPQDPCTLYDLTTLLKYPIQNPNTKVTWEKTITPTLHAIQKEQIQQTINQTLNLPTFTKNQIIQLLYNITKPKKNQKWTNTLINDLLNTIAQEKKPQTILHFLNIIHQHHISPQTLQKALQTAQNNHLTTLNHYPKALYHQLLQDNLTLILPNEILATAQQRINPTLWQLLHQIDPKKAPQLFNLCHEQYQNLTALYNILCLLTNCNATNLPYQALADTLLLNSPDQWENLTHQHLTENTFSKPHEPSPKEILDTIQQSSQTEKTYINTQDLNTTHQDIHTQLHKHHLPPQPIHPKIDQYYEQAQQSQKQEKTLHIACRKNDLQIVQQLIEKHNVNINPTDKNGNTPLHIACIKGYQEIVQYLVKNGANTNSKNKQEDTPLQSARRHNRNQTITYLNNLPKPIPQRIAQYTEQSQKEGYRTLDHACMNGDLQAVQHLIQNQHTDPHQTDNNGSNALHFACCRKGTLDTVKYLVEKQHINPTQANKLDLKPLHYACMHGRIEIVQYLIENTDIDINQKSTSGKKALDLAKENNHQKLITYLTHRLQPLQKRITHYTHQSKDNPDGDTPLHLASKQSDLTAIKHLITNHQCNPNATNYDNDTPLHYAILGGHLQAIQYLVENGANTQAQNIDSNTPLQLAQRKNYIQITNYLQNPPNTIAQWSKKHIKQWAENYKITEPQLSQTLAVITRAVQLHEKYTPRPVQILTLLTLYHGVQTNNLKGRLAQVMTGEGKSITIAMLAILHALQGHTIDITTTSTELSKREVQEKAALFALFNITVAENGPTENLPNDEQNALLKLVKYLKNLFGKQYHKNPYQSQVVYGTPHNFQADILRTEFYGQKEVRTNRTFDIVIVDEVDSLFVDGRKHSTYLADATPGMDLLQIPLAAVWHHVGNITQHIYTNPQGQHYYIEPDFEIKDDQLILHTDQPFETCSTPIQEDKDEFIKKLALQILQDLLRNPTDQEKQAWEELQNLEDQINTQHDELIALTNQEQPNEQALTQKKQQIKTLQTQRLQTPWYQKKYTTYLELPDYLRDHIHNQLPQWIENALHAQNYFAKEREYDVVGNKITPIDHDNTGVLQHNQVYKQGLDQFLSIKENLPLKPENLTTNYMSNVTLFTRYNTLYGLTGTLGSSASKNFLRQTYQLDTITLPPHKKRTIQGNTNPHLPCKILTPHLCKEDYTYTLFQSIYQQIRLGRSILIICPYINYVNAIADQLKQERKILESLQTQQNLLKQANLNPDLLALLAIKNITTYTGQTKFTKKKVDVGEIIIATNIAGRGTDLTTTPALEANGGLHVCITYLPKNQRVEAQAQGRTARSGKLGTAQLIIYNPQAQSIAQLKTQRAQQEEQAMQKAAADVTHIRFKDKIFQNFCSLLNNYLQLDSDTYYKRLNPELNNDTNYPSYPCPNWGPPIRASLQEQFGLWLCSTETLLQQENYTAVEEKFQTLKNKILDNVNKYKPAENPYYYVLEGNLHIRRALQQKEPDKSLYQQALHYYNQAIDQDPILALHAYYNKAYALFYLEEKPDQATQSLKAAQKTLTDYYKPNLFILHHLITQKGGKKTISAQVQRQLNLLLLVDQYIDDALATIEQVKENNKSVLIDIYKHVVAIDTHQPIEDIIQSRSHQTHTKPIATKEDIEQFKLGGITHLFTLKEVIPQATIVTLAIISVSEIVVGGIIIVYSGGAASHIGYTLIQEGISDTIQTFKAAHSRQFDWKEWGIQKGISLTVGIATAGMNHGLGNVGADLKDIGKNVFKDIKTWKNIGLTQETQALKNLCQKTISHHFKKGIAKKCVNTLVDYGVEKAIHNYLEPIIAQAIQNTLTHALENNPTLQKALALDKASKSNYWQNHFLQQGNNILQNNWSGWKKFLHNTLQGKTNPDQASDLFNRPHIYTFFRQLGIASIDDDTVTKVLNPLIGQKGTKYIHSASTVIKIFEGLLGAIDCVTLTHNFLQEFEQKIQPHIPIINRNYEETQKDQAHLQATQNDTVTTQKTTQQNTPYYQQQAHTNPQPIQVATPPTPQKNPQPIHHRTQDKKDNNDDSDDDNEEPATLQETLPNNYIPSDIKELQNTFKNALASHITHTIHQRGIQPITSATVDYGIDKLTEESDKQLKEAIAQQQRKNKFSYKLQKTKIHKTSQNQDQQKQSDLSRLLSGDAQPKDEVEQIAQAIAQGAEGDAIPLEILAKKENATIYVYNSEGELITIKGDGSGQRMELTYTPPQDGQAGHWAPKGIKNYETTGPTNCLYDAVAALTGNGQNADTLRQYCAQQILANKDTLKPIIGDYYTLCITRPDAIYTGAGLIRDGFVLALKCKESWENFKEKYPRAAKALALLKKGLDAGIFVVAAGTTIATGGAAGAVSVGVKVLGGIIISQLYDYVISKNQGVIQGGEKWLAAGLKKLDPDFTDTEANQSAKLLINVLIEVGRTATHYAAGKAVGKAQKALQTHLKTTTHRKGYVKQYVRTSVKKLGIPKHINQGMQGKHMTGHTNFIQGRSILKQDANKLLVGIHKGKYKIARVINDGKVIVNFNKSIGDFYLDGKYIGPTKYGRIDFGKNGAHIIPANPEQFKK